jgi:hypothetical protein
MADEHFLKECTAAKKSQPLYIIDDVCQHLVEAMICLSEVE